MAVPSNSTTFSQLQVLQTFLATREELYEEVVDSVWKSKPTLEFFQAKAKSGSGRGIRFNVKLKALNQTGYTDSKGSYTTDEAGDVVESAFYNWPPQVSTPLTLNHRELKMNEGRAQIINLLSSYMKFAQEDHANFLNNALWKTTFSDDKSQIIPITTLVDDTAPVGGIDPKDGKPGHNQWASVVRTLDLTPDADGQVASIITAMELLVDDIFVKSGTRPDHFIFGRAVYDAIRAEARRDNRNVQDRNERQELAFTDLVFETFPVRLDPDAPTNVILAINTEYLTSEYLADEFAKPVNPTGDGTNEGELNTTTLTVTTWQIATDRRNAHGKIKVTLPA